MRSRRRCGRRGPGTSGEFGDEDLPWNFGLARSAGQSTDLFEERIALERFDDVVVRLDRPGSILVKRLEGAGEQQDGHHLHAGIGLDRLAHLIAAFARHRHVRENEVGAQLSRFADRFEPVVHRNDLEVLGSEDHPDHFSDRERVISNQQALGHGRGALLGGKLDSTRDSTLMWLVVGSVKLVADDFAGCAQAQSWQRARVTV
jgi:hypothetical protein